MAEQLGNVSQACKVFGYSRDSFYRYKQMYDEGGEMALAELSRKKANPKNRIDPAIEARVVAHALEQPAFGQLRTSNELKKEGVFVSPCGVRCVWLRHNLETFKKRLKALEAKVAEEGVILTESQVAALEKAKVEKEAHGEIETHHPGYLGAQDTYYVGTIKGVGRIYQQTFIDTYAKVVHCKLYDRKNALVAADLLNDRVVPFYDEQGIPLLRVLTDRGTEYCGAREHHEYQPGHGGSTWPLKILIIPGRKPRAHRRMVFVSVFTALSRTSFTLLLSARKSTLAWSNYRRILTVGLVITMGSVPILENIATGERPCKLSKKILGKPKKKC